MCVVLDVEQGGMRKEFPGDVRGRFIPAHPVNGCRAVGRREGTDKGRDRHIKQKYIIQGEASGH